MFDIEECFSSYFLTFFWILAFQCLFCVYTCFCLLCNWLWEWGCFLSAYCSGRSGVIPTGEQHYHISRQDTDFRAQILYSSSKELMFVLKLCATWDERLLHWLPITSASHVLYKHKCAVSAQGITFRLCSEALCVTSSCEK